MADFLRHQHQRAVLLLVAVELRRLVVLAASAALDFLFFCEQRLERRVGFLDEGLGLVGRLLVGCALDRHRLLGGTASAAARADDAAASGGLPGGLADGHGRFLGDLVLGRRLVREDVALVDPDLHTDAPERGARFGLAVVDVGPEGVQRNPAFAVPLLAAHLRPAEASTALHPDALGPRLHRRLHGALHRPAERHAPRELVGDALGDERGVELRLLDLLDVEVDLRVAGDLEQSGAQPVGFGAAAADHDAGAGRVHVDTEPVARPLDLDSAHGGVRQLATQIDADLPVLDQGVLVLLLVGEPARLPVGGDPETEPIGIDLLAHQLSFFFFVVFFVGFCGFLAVVFLAVVFLAFVAFFVGFLVAGAFFFAGAFFAGASSAAPSGWASTSSTSGTSASATSSPPSSASSTSSPN